MSNRQIITRQAYGQAIVQSDPLQNGMAEFLPDSRIGRLELVVTGEYCDYDFDPVEIETIEQPAPQTVMDALELLGNKKQVEQESPCSSRVSI